MELFPTTKRPYILYSAHISYTLSDRRQRPYQWLIHNAICFISYQESRWSSYKQDNISNEKKSGSAAALSEPNLSNLLEKWKHVLWMHQHYLSKIIKSHSACTFQPEGWVAAPWCFHPQPVSRMAATACLSAHTAPSQAPSFHLLQLQSSFLSSVQQKKISVSNARHCLILHQD